MSELTLENAADETEEHKNQQALAYFYYLRLKKADARFEGLNVIEDSVNKLSNGDRADGQQIFNKFFGIVEKPKEVANTNAAEAEHVKELITNMAKVVEVGSEWYIVSMKWIEKWQKHVNFDQEE